MNVGDLLKGKNGMLLGAGFLLGSVGLKLITSDAAKRLYVRGVAAGMRAKQGYEDIVEQARAEVDDIVAEAAYMNECDGLDHADSTTAA